MNKTHSKIVQIKEDEAHTNEKKVLHQIHTKCPPDNFAVKTVEKNIQIIKMQKFTGILDFDSNTMEQIFESA